MCIQETISTLSFAQNAKLIKNKAIINEEVSNDYLYKEEIRKLKEKYNTIEAEKNYYRSIVMGLNGNGNQNDISNKSINSKGGNNNIGLDIDNLKEEIDSIMAQVSDKEEQLKDINDENNILKEKIVQFEAEKKLKENDLKEVKEMFEEFKKEQDVKISKLNEFVLKSVYLEQNVSNLEIKLKNKEFKLIKEIEELSNIIKENKLNLESKEKTISILNEEINTYMSIVTSKDNKIQELKNELQNKEIEINGLIYEKEKHINRNHEMTKEINLIKENVNDVNSKLKIKDIELNDYKKLGKNINNNYEKQIDVYKLKITEMEEINSTLNLELKNVNKFIEELKLERQSVENKLFA